MSQKGQLIAALEENGFPAKEIQVPKVLPLVLVHARDLFEAFYGVRDPIHPIANDLGIQILESITIHQHRFPYPVVSAVGDAMILPHVSCHTAYYHVMSGDDMFAAFYSGVTPKDSIGYATSVGALVTHSALG